MIKISFQFNETAGILKDMEFCLYFLYNNNYNQKVEKYKVFPNKNVQKSLGRLSKKIHLDEYKKYIDLFFNDKVLNNKLIIGFPIQDLYEFWKFKNINELILYFKNMSSEIFIINTLTSINENIKNIDEIIKSLNDKTYIFNLVETLPINDEYKWKIAELICNVEIYKKNYIEFLEHFSIEYMKENEQIKKFKTKFNNHIVKMLKSDGKKYIENILDGRLDISENNIYISTLFYGNFNISIEKHTESDYLMIGIDSEKIYKSFNNKNFINIFKNLGDSTRFNVLKILYKNNYITLQELADKLNVSIPTISYHIESLTLYNLISIKKAGNKSIYKVNTDTIKSCCEYLSKEFNLK